MQQLSGLDAFMLYAEAGGASANNVGCVNIYDPSTAAGGSVSFEQFLGFIGDRIHAAKTYRQRLVRVPFDLDHPYWVEDKTFDLEYHVREIALPAPGDFRQLCTQVARIHARPFDFNRPLWEIYFITGLSEIDGCPPGCFAVLNRMHHTVVDGNAGMEMVNATHSLTPKVEPPLPAVPFTGEDVPSPVSLLLRSGVRLASQPVSLAKALTRAVPVVRNLAPLAVRREISLVADIPPKSRFNVPLASPHIGYDARSFDFDDWKRIRKTVSGATINDVALAIIGGALRSYLLRHDDLPDRPLAAAIPISLRSKDAGVMEGNDIAMMTASLHTTVEDPIERLTAVAKSTAASKLRKEAMGARTLTNISQQLPGRLIGLGVRVFPEFGRTSRLMPGLPASAGLPLPITNVPGAPVPIYMDGAKMLRMFGLGPVVHWMAAMHVVGTYAGRATISVTANRDVMPDVTAYGEDLQRSFEALVAVS